MRLLVINGQTQLILQLLHFALDISLLVSQIICFSNKKLLLNIWSQYQAV